MNLQRREEIRELANWLDVSEWYHATQYQEAIRELLAHIDTLEQTAAERVIARGAAVKPHTFAEIVNQVRDISNQYAGTEQLRERIAYALTPHFERNGGPTPDYTGEGSAWMPPVDARAVVVPVESHSIGTADSVYFRRELESLTQRLPSADGPWLARYLLKLARVADSTAVDCAPVDARAVVVPEPSEIDAAWNEYATRSPGMISDDPDADLEVFSAGFRAGSALHIPADRVLGDGMVAVDRGDCALAVEWCHAVQDLNPGYLEAKDHEARERFNALRANQGGAAT